MTDTIQAIEAKLAEIEATGTQCQRRAAEATQRAQDAAADALLAEGEERADAEKRAEEARREVTLATQQAEACVGAAAALQRRLETARAAEALAAREQRDRELLVKFDAARAALRRAAGTINTAGLHIAEAMEAARAVAASAPEAPLGMAFARLREGLAEHIRREVPLFIELTNERSPFARPDPSSEICRALADDLRRAGLLSTVKQKD